MIDGIQMKVCGITSLGDADWAATCGADYLGINLFPGSPRYVNPAKFAALAEGLSGRRRVAVSVEPTVEELRRQDAAGFDRFQIHFRPEAAAAQLPAWAETVGRDRLWLAPKLAPGTPLPASLLEQAQVFMLDGYKSGQFGGTGVFSDWGEFRRLRQAHGGKTWILAGGLSPDNIERALAETDARFVDVNSGVESSPGVKDPEKLKAFVAAMRRARGPAARA